MKWFLIIPHIIFTIVLTSSSIASPKLMMEGHNNSEILGDNLKEITKLNIEQCGALCRDELGCSAFNWSGKTGGNESVCRLIATSRFEKPNYNVTSNVKLFNGAALFSSSLLSLSASGASLDQEWFKQVGAGSAEAGGLDVFVSKNYVYIRHNMCSTPTDLQDIKLVSKPDSYIIKSTDEGYQEVSKAGAVTKFVTQNIIKTNTLCNVLVKMPAWRSILTISKPLPNGKIVWGFSFQKQ